MCYEEILIYDLRKLPEDRKNLESITNPLEKKWKARSIADRERLLEQLTDDERFLVEEIVISNRKAHELTEKTGLTVKEIWAARRDAIEKLCRLRHGAAYQP